MNLRTITSRTVVNRLTHTVQHNRSLLQPCRYFSITDKVSGDVDRGFRILGVQQIAIGGKSKSDLAHLW